MTGQEINAKVAAGRKKAEQRRGSGNQMGLAKTRMVEKVVWEQEVIPAKTPEEVVASIKAGQERARKRHEEVLLARQEAKKVSQTIQKRGYKLDYDLTHDKRIAMAYTWDFQTGKAEVFFTVRSEKDQFSRREARASLLDHMNEGSHCLAFRINNLERSFVKKVVEHKLVERTKTHPHEFPSKFVSSVALRNSVKYH